MDKIKVNNQVVAMRKHVKRAKLFVINKFTKQMKQLQNKKGSDTQKEKNQRKSERLLEKIKILKQMKPDVVSKKALSKAQDWGSILTQKNIPLEDQCLALLANDSAVQKEVENFCSKEIRLVEKIPLLFQAWEIKNEEKEKEGSPNKKRKASDIKKQKLEKIAKRKKTNFKNPKSPHNLTRDKPNKNPIRTEPGDNNDDINLANRNPEPGDNNDTNLANGNPEPDDDDDTNSENDSELVGAVLNENDSIKSESSNDSDEDASEGEGFFTRVKEDDNNKNKVKHQKPPKNSEKVVNNLKGKKNAKSSTTKTNLKNPVSVRRESNAGSDAIPQTTIFDRLNSIANNNRAKVEPKKTLSKEAIQKNKAIAVLDLNNLQDSEKIPINSVSVDLEDDLPQPVGAKKDSFFLNGDEDPDSGSEKEERTRRDRPSKRGGKFQSFDREKPNRKMRRNLLNGRSPNDNYKGNKFNTNENRFRKQFIGNKEFNSDKRFDKNPRNNSQQFKNFNQAGKNNSFNPKNTDNKKNLSNNSFTPNKPMAEKGEENAKLHPSWEAKKKAKMVEKSGFQGKRMVFD